jgi:uncharacterized protein YndB with AHSA1/START domain
MKSQYTPGPASAELRKDGEEWSFVLTRELQHPPAKVWSAITEPEHLRAWAPFDSDKSLGGVGTAKLSFVGTPHGAETQVRRADPPRSLEYTFGGGWVRWELEPMGANGTRLTLWAQIGDRKYIAMGAAGWHVCLDVMERSLSGHPIERIAGPEAMKNEGWQRLNAEYVKQFAV